jgi:hypothetical protein
MTLLYKFESLVVALGLTSQKSCNRVQALQCKQAINWHSYRKLCCQVVLPGAVLCCGCLVLKLLVNQNREVAKWEFHGHVVCTNSFPSRCRDFNLYLSITSLIILCGFPEPGAGSRFSILFLSRFKAEFVN